jgi:hypothetical protein
MQHVTYMEIRAKNKQTGKSPNEWHAFAYSNRRTMSYLN